MRRNRSVAPAMLILLAAWLVVRRLSIAHDHPMLVVGTMLGVLVVASIVLRRAQWR